MAKFSKISEERLLTCHPDIVAVCRELIKQMDVSGLRFDAIARVLRERGEIMSNFVWGGEFKRLKDCPHIEIKEE